MGVRLCYVTNSSDPLGPPILTVSTDVVTTCIKYCATSASCEDEFCTGLPPCGDGAPCYTLYGFAGPSQPSAWWRVYTCEPFVGACNGPSENYCSESPPPPPAPPPNPPKPPPAPPPLPPARVADPTFCGRTTPPWEGLTQADCVTGYGALCPGSIALVGPPNACACSCDINAPEAKGLGAGWIALIVIVCALPAVLAASIFAHKKWKRRAAPVHTGSRELRI